MPAKTSKRTDPWAALDAIMATDPEPMGPEWFTCAEFADRYKMNPRTAHAKLANMARQGLLDKWSGRREGHSGGHFCKFRMK